MSLFAKLGDFMRANSRPPVQPAPEVRARPEVDTAERNAKIAKLQRALGRANRDHRTEEAAHLRRQLEALL